MKYRKKQPWVDAIQYQREHNIHEVQDFFDTLAKIHGDHLRAFRYQAALNEYTVTVMRGNGKYDLHVLQPGEWIIREGSGPYGVIPDGQFQKHYEEVES